MTADGTATPATKEAVNAARVHVPPATADYLTAWEAFFDTYATQVERWRRRNPGYHRSITSLARFYVPPGQRVLEVGSGCGDLLAALEPSYGRGVDLSAAMVRLARSRHPHLTFLQMPAETLGLPGETFDYIVLSDLVGYLYDIRAAFERLRSVSHSRTRIVLHWYSRLWQPVLRAAELMGLKYPQPQLNWTTVDDIANLLHLAGFELVHRRAHILVPKRIPFLSEFAKRYLAHLPGLRWLCLTNWVVARPAGLPVPQRFGWFMVVRGRHV